MTWKLWLDDQLSDPSCPERHTPEGYLGASSSVEAQALVREKGMPSFMDLDHDLGPDDDALVFLRWLEGYWWETRAQGKLPTYQVHSRNTVGQVRIRAFLDNWQKFLEE